MSAQLRRVSPWTLERRRTDLLEQIRAESINPAPTPAAATPNQTSDPSIVAALREQLRGQKQQYQTEIAKLKAEVKNLEQALAAAHGELHQRSKYRTSHQPGALQTSDGSNCQVCGVRPGNGPHQVDVQWTRHERLSRRTNVTAKRFATRACLPNGEALSGHD